MYKINKLEKVTVKNTGNPLSSVEMCASGWDMHLKINELVDLVNTLSARLDSTK